MSKSDVMTYYEHLEITVYAWASDFVRAVYERPVWVQWIVRLAVGRYAWRELIGIRDAILKAGLYVNIGYGLENQDYHKDKMPWSLR